MFYENEFAMLVISLCVGVFIFLHYTTLRRVPGFVLLVLSFGSLAAASVFTIIEGFAAEEFWNIAEHLGYALSGFFLFLWCAIMFGIKVEGEDGRSEVS